MKDNLCFAWFYLSACIMMWGGLYAQPATQGRPIPIPSREAPIDQALRPLIQHVKEIAHQVRNHEAEIQVVQEQLKNQETTWQHIQDTLQEGMESQKEVVRALQRTSEAAIQTGDQSVKNLESMVRSTISDVHMLKAQINETVQRVADLSKKMGDIEELVSGQNQHLQEFGQTLQFLMDTLKGKEQKIKQEKSGNATYQVKSGDSLEKIARLHKVTVQAIREANHLQSDRIVPGQTLQIP